MADDDRIAFDIGETLKEEDLDFITVDWPIPPAQSFEVWKPSNGQIALAGATASRGGAQALAAVLDMFDAIFPPEGYRRIVAYLNDPRYPNSETKVIDFFFDLMRRFTGNPTGSPSGSTPSSQSGGRTSTASTKRPASTRSSSRPRVSSISPGTGS